MESRVVRLSAPKKGGMNGPNFLLRPRRESARTSSSGSKEKRMRINRYWVSRVPALFVMILSCKQLSPQKERQVATGGGQESLGPTSPAKDASHGYIVIGPHAQVYGLRPYDTLPEIPPNSAPAGVRVASARLASEGQSDARCTRYFGGRPFVVVFEHACAGVRRSDSRRVAVVSPSGVPMRVPQLWIEEYAGLCPPYRDETGQAIGLEYCKSSDALFDSETSR